MCKIDNTVKIIGQVPPLPSFVYEVLRLGPRNPVLSNFDPKNILCELDLLLESLESKWIENKSEVINDLNSLSHSYIKQAKRQIPKRVIHKTFEFLKANKLKAIPYDKGLGFCIMTEGDYRKRLEEIINLQQFKPQEKAG